MRILTLSDIHEPYNINLKPVLDFCDDWGPDVIQFLGDATNAESCNHWKEEKGIKKDVWVVSDDYKNLEKNVLEPFRKALIPGSKMVYHLGNHEDWFYQAMLSDWKIGDKYRFEKNIDLKKYNMRMVKLNEFSQFGHLYFTHGCYASGDNHAKKMALHYRKNIRYGHIHDVQEYSIQSPLDHTEKITAKSIGCLCHMDQMYMKKKPSKWVQAFNAAHIRRDGCFNDYTVVITDGVFTSPEGKVYR